jgi:hypothetical protein
MKKYVYLLLCLCTSFASCNKGSSSTDSDVVNIEAVRALNAAKVTITNGVWGTVSTIEGNCMPFIGTGTASTCKAYAIQREVRIYAYTTTNDALPKNPLIGLYDSFSTALLKTVQADAKGFYQVSLPDGKYTIVFVEDGKLYSNSFDNNGGLTAVEVKQNKVLANLVLMRAVY